MSSTNLIQKFTPMTCTVWIKPAALEKYAPNRFSSFARSNFRWFLGAQVPNHLAWAGTRARSWNQLLVVSIISFTSFVLQQLHHHTTPQTVAGFKKCFWEQGQTRSVFWGTVSKTWESIKNPLQLTVCGKCKMKPPKKNQKRQDRKQDLRKADTPSNTKAGHLQKALTTPNKLYCLQENEK